MNCDLRVATKWALIRGLVEARHHVEVVLVWDMNGELLSARRGEGNNLKAKTGCADHLENCIRCMLC